MEAYLKLSKADQERYLSLPEDQRKEMLAPLIAEIENQQAVSKQSDAELKAKIPDLKPGETVKLSDGTSYKRNSDMTLTKRSLDAPTRTYVTTTYSADSSTILSQDIPSKIKLNGNKYVPTHVTYKNGKPDCQDTDFTDIQRNSISNSAPSSSLLGLMRSKQNYSSQVFNDNKGNALVTFKDGKYFDKKGKEIDQFKAMDILDKALDKNQLGHLIQNF